MKKNEKDLENDLALEKLQGTKDEWNKRKAEKAKIKDEFMPIAWHPSRWWDWCVPEDKKRETENFFF